jgi:hypothetical protein
MSAMKWMAAAAATALAVTTIALADEEEAQQQQQPGATAQAGGVYNEADLRTVTLTVKKVDPSKHTVQFEATVKPEADIKQSGQPIRIDDLKPGDTVRASFDPKTGDVVRVDVRRGPSK